jgi:hypothetical protein
MAIAKGTNSYATLEEAIAYFADRLDVAAWTDANATQQAQALVTATSILDDQHWMGTAISEAQPLAFPRCGSYFDPRLGVNITVDNATPDRITRATFELAHHLLGNDGLLDDTGQVLDLQVGSVNLTKIVKPNLIPANVRRLIKPLLTNAGSSAWWRNN